MTASARDVAAALRERLPGLDRLKLHKLLYYCQGHHLAHFDAPLFSDTISAWDMGPVVVDLWYEEKYPDAYVSDDEFDALPSEPPPSQLDEGQLNTIGYVVSRYGRRYGHELAAQTHGETPWMTANEGRGRGGSVEITTGCIADYFREITEAERQEDLQFDPAELAKIFSSARAHLADVQAWSAQPDEMPELRQRRNALIARQAGA